MTEGTREIATFGGGCFWCIEAVFEKLDGVETVVSGYMGGHQEKPTYEEVCTGKTGHAEVCQIHFNPDEISYEDLLDLFWQAHDPTTLDRQGTDIGSQYRSVIFYQDENQKRLAEKSREAASSQFKNPIVTAIQPTEPFYEAEGYHQDYFRNNPNAPYCTFVIKPKVKSLEKKGLIRK